MIFRPELAAKVLAGKKTQTRRPIRKGEAACRYRLGGSYAVQPGRCRPALARLIVIDVREELLHEIADEDVRAEGFPERKVFFAYWRELYPNGPLMQVPVWVISFVLDRSHHPRLLARRSELGYTEEPREALVSGREPEPEAVDEDWLELFSRRARENAAMAQARAAAEREQMALSARLAILEAEAEKGADLGRQIARARQAIEAAETKLERLSGRGIRAPSVQSRAS